MKRDSFRAMGTTVVVVSATQAGVEATRRLFQDLEGRFSRFLPGSELTSINEDRRSAVEVSPLMAALLRTADRLRARTAGLVDPAVGEAVVAWGYDCSFEQVTDRNERPAQHWPKPWQVEGTTLLRAPGTRIDLGGIAKGWSADRAVESGRALLVSAGGDARSALDDAHVEVIDPWERRPATVRMGRGGLATSSVSRRRWRVAGREAHHLIDPRTGDPAQTPVLSASTVCATAVEAEAAAKAVLLHGADGLAWAADQPWVAAAMVSWADGSVFATTGWEMAA
jgi:thiamine biosynthesis lipoprotein